MEQGFLRDAFDDIRLQVRDPLKAARLIILIALITVARYHKLKIYTGTSFYRIRSLSTDLMHLVWTSASLGLILFIGGNV